MGAEDRFASHLHACTFCSFPAVASSGFDQFTFEFGQPTQHRQHQPSPWSCRVRPGVGQGFKQASLVSDLFNRGQQIDRGPSQTIQPRHNDHGPRLQRIKEPLQLGPVAFSPADLLTVNFRTIGLPQLFELRLQGLALSGHPCIANVHGTNLTRNYGTFKPLISLNLVCVSELRIETHFAMRVGTPHFCGGRMSQVCL